MKNKHLSDNNEMGWGGSRPNPDPTLLTTALVDKAISTVKESVNNQIGVLILRANSAADNLKQIWIAISDLKERVSAHHQELKSIASGVNIRFSERDLRFSQGEQDSKDAIAAALTATKETMTKLELGFTKQIDSQQAQMTTMQKTFDDKISDLKLSRADYAGQKRGADHTWGYLGTIAALVIALLGLLFSQNTNNAQQQLNTQQLQQIQSLLHQLPAH